MPQTLHEWVKKAEVDAGRRAGVLSEVIQGLIGRDAGLMDAVADLVAIATALLIWAKWRGFRPRRATDVGPGSEPST